jgi:crotonobetainyl-CoA:carnitine CoA-transferase CaiB-like acyl-CoA transferase
MMPDAQRKDRGPLPLADVKVVDFARLLPGPWATQMLADFGADVIKVEQIGMGDPSRHNPPTYRDESVYFYSVNSNKRGIALDLSRPAGVEIAHKLLAWADVAVESFRPSVAAKLQVDYETAKGLKPSIIYCSISGFGQTGPLADVPGHDLVIQAMAGILKSHQDRDGVPAMPPFQAGDLAGANMACIGILSALRRRDRTGEGCLLDIALLDSLIAMSNISLLPGLSRAAGGTGVPVLEAWGANPRYAIYPTADGKHVAVCLLEAKLWQRFCRAIGRVDLIVDERPQDRHSSHGGRARLYREAIAAFCLDRPRDAIAAEMAGLGIPVMPVLSPDEALAHENVSARQIAAILPHPTQNRITEIANPLQSAGLTRPGPRTHAPRLSEGAADILEMLGYDTSAIDQLRQDGVI